MQMIKAIECGLIIVTNQLNQLYPLPLASRYTHPDRYIISRVMATSIKPYHRILVTANAWHGRLQAIIIKLEMQIYWIQYCMNALCL